MYTSRKRLLLLLATVSMALVASAQAVPAGAAPATTRHVVSPVKGARVNPHQMPTQPPAGETPREVSRHYPVDRATYERLKAQVNAAADARDQGLQRSLGGPAPRFPTLGLADGGGWNPPDGALAVGPTSLLTGVNEAFALFNESGAELLGPISFDSFFGESGSIYDPRALFDAGNGIVSGYNGGQGRFVLLATDGTNFALAASENASPENSATTWCTYLVNGVTTNADGSTDWVDYPALGMDGDYLYITSNQFSNGSNSFQYARLMILSKASVYPDATTGSCPTITGWDTWNLQNPGGGAAFSIQPATEPDALPGTGGTMYLVNAIWSSGSNLPVRSVTNTVGAAPVVNDPGWVQSGWIAPYTLPANAPQPFGSRIDTGDTRLLGAVYRYGSIYTANTTGTVSSSLSSSPNAYANAQWYQITPGASLQGTSQALTNPSVAFFFPGIMPTCSISPCSSPNVALELSVSGRRQSASAAAAKGSQVSVFAAGVGGYQLGTRWGDYPALAADPTSTGTAWLLGEYARSSGAWGTAVSNVTQ